MTNYRLSLSQDLPNRTPSAFQVTYTDTNHHTQQWFFHDAVGPDRDTSVLTVSSGVDLVNQPHVKTRSLKAFYPSTPDELNFSILSVARA